MSDLLSFIVKEYMDLVKTDETGIKYVLNDEIDSLELSDAEKAIIRMALSAQNIQLRDRPITKEDRPAAVEEYAQNVTASFEVEDDSPSFKTLDELEKYIKEEFIPNNVKMKINRNGKGHQRVKKGEIYPSIQWNKIKKLGLNKEETDFVFKLLEDSGIRVGGLDTEVDTVSDNYDYVSTYETRDYPEPFDRATTIQKFIDYKNETDPTKKIELRNELIEHNLRLVSYVAWGIAEYYDIDIQDAEQDGIVGLIYAVEHFNPFMGYTFSAYAVPCIKGRLLRAISDDVNISFNSNEDLSLIRKTIKLVEERWGCDFDGNEKMLGEILEFIAAFKGISVERLQVLGNKLRVLYSSSIDVEENWDQVEEEEDDATYVRPVIKSGVNSDLASQAESSLIKEYISNALHTLTLREQKVIELRFGLIDGQPKTFDEVARYFNISRSRAAQIEAKAIRKLRHPTRSNKLRDILYADPGSFYDYYDQKNGTGKKLM